MPTTFCIFHLQFQQQLSQDPTNKRTTEVQKGKAIVSKDVQLSITKANIQTRTSTWTQNPYLLKLLWQNNTEAHQDFLVLRQGFFHSTSQS